MALIPFELFADKKPLGLRGRDPIAAFSRDWDFDKLALPAAPAGGAEISLLPHMPPVFDQKNSSSCVAQAFAAGIYAAEHRAGLSPAVPSRLYLYYFARHLDGLQGADGGCYLHSCAEALRRYGVPDETEWPFGSFTLTVNKRPSVASMGQGHARHGGKYVRIRDVGERRCDAIDAALHAGHPVAFGTVVSRAFMKNDGPGRVPLPDFGADKLAGLHAMLVVGRAMLDGSRHYLVRNSWSSRWRDGGYVYLSDEYVQSQLSDDFQIVYGWKRLGEVS